MQASKQPSKKMIRKVRGHEILAKLPTRNPLYRAFWTFDSYVSSGLFEIWDGIKRGSSAYSSFIHRFSIKGPKRWLIDIIDDMATLGTAAAFGLLAFALPPFSDTGDIWDKGREYAVTFTDGNGEIIGRRGIRQDDAVPLEEISPLLIKAILATEDARFFDHFGVDLIGTARALKQNASANGVRQGGSSITQQVAKNLFLSPERTITRKVHEAFFSLWLEARLTKEEILKLYLDRSYLGGGNYGVEAAAQFYFGRSARDVTLSEAAMMAGLFKAPTNYAPHQNIEAARARANVVLYRMLDSGFITQGDLLQARRSPVQVVAQNTTESPNWFLDWAYRDAISVLEEQRITGEFVIEVKTTINPKLQFESQKILNETLDGEGVLKKFEQAAAITMAPDGAVRAIVGGRNYEESQFNRATDAKRQSGSAFKPFVYLAGLRGGFTPDQIVVDEPVSVGNWSPRNYSEKYVGRTTLTSALAHSYNSIPVKIMQAVGRKAIIKAAHDAGIQGELETWAPMVLGTSALTLMDLTRGYATFAASGKLAEPYAVLEIRKPNGDILYSRSKNAVDAPQAVEQESVAQLNVMLSAVVKAGTARRADLGFTPQGGKTGTNQGYRDAWYVGFTANNVTGVWVGNDDFTPMDEVTGGQVPAPIWKRIMDVAEVGFKPASLAGIPLDDTYAPVLVAAAEVAPELPGASGLPEESGIVTADGENGAAVDSTVVLNDMFSLFKKKNATGAQPRIQTAARAKRNSSGRKTQAQLILPKANTARKTKTSFFDSLFSSESKAKKRKKKKTLFGF